MRTPTTWSPLISNPALTSTTQSRLSDLLVLETRPRQWTTKALEILASLKKSLDVSVNALNRWLVLLEDKTTARWLSKIKIRDHHTISRINRNSHNRAISHPVIKWAQIVLHLCVKLKVYSQMEFTRALLTIWKRRTRTSKERSLKSRWNSRDRPSGPVVDTRWVLKITNLIWVITKTSIGSRYLLKAWAQPDNKEKTVVNWLRVLSIRLILCPRRASSAQELTTILTLQAALLEIVPPRGAPIDQASMATWLKVAVI